MPFWSYGAGRPHKNDAVRNVGNAEIRIFKYSLFKKLQRYERRRFCEGVLRQSSKKAFITLESCNPIALRGFHVHFVLARLGPEKS